MQFLLISKNSHPSIQRVYSWGPKNAWLLDWCICNGESVDHFLIHCPVTF